MSDPHVWNDPENSQWGIEAPKDADKRALLDEILNCVEGMTCADFANDAVERMSAALVYMPLYSVVKADHHHIDPDACGGWHSEASGARVMPAWFVPSSTLYGEIDKVAAGFSTPEGKP